LPSAQAGATPWGPLLVAETVFAGSTKSTLLADELVRVPVALVAGVVVGTVTSLLGVAGGELIIPS